MTSRNATSRSGSAYGSGRSSTPLTIEKMAVFAPTPSATDRIAAAAKPGSRSSVRAE